MNLYKIVAFVLLMSVVSCSSDENTTEDIMACESAGGNANQLKSSIIESINEYNGQMVSVKQCFSYDNENRLESISNESFNYDSNGNIIKYNITHSDGDIEVRRRFEYDQQQRLIRYSTFNTDVMLSYTDNLVTITGSVTKELELDAQGFVSKLSFHDGSYIIYEYDQRHNVISIQEFANNGAIRRILEYTYDSNPNPYYGLLNSIYLERFLRTYENGRGYFFSGINFPYLQNNVTDITLNNTFLWSSVYEYNTMNLPVNRQNELFFITLMTSEEFFSY